jgi:hypothetical protein
MSIQTPEAPREHEAPQQERQGDANANTNARIKWGALLLVGVSALVGASFFVGMSVGDDSSQVATLNKKVGSLNSGLTATQRATETQRGRADDADSKVDDLTTKLEAAQAEVATVTGAEESLEDPAAGINAKLTSKGKTLKLEEMGATLLGHQVASAISTDIDTQRAEGKFVTVTMRLENRTNSPQAPPDDDAYRLVIDGQEFNADFDAMNLPGNSFVWADEEISPGSGRVGTVTFDVSGKAANKASSGIVFVPQFSDASGFDDEAALPMAGLRLK